MGKENIRYNKILSKKIDIMKIEIENSFKQDNPSRLLEQLSELKNEAVGNKTMLSRLAELEHSLHQKFKKPQSTIRSNQVGIAPTTFNIEDAVSKAQSRYNTLYKQLTVKSQNKYVQPDLKPPDKDKHKLESSKLTLASLDPIEKILAKYSKRLDKLCKNKSTKTKSTTNTLPEDAEYIIAKKLSSQLKAICIQLKEAKSLSDQVAIIEKIKDSFNHSIEDFPTITEGKVKKCLPSLFSPPSLVNIFTNYLNKDRQVIDDKLKSISRLQHKI